MENKVLQENIDAIKKYDNDLANKILMFDNEKSNLTLFQNETGEYNLAYKNISIHSFINPIAEAKKIANGIPDDKNGIVIVYGLGLGYLPDELSKVVNHAKIIVYEPEIEVLSYVLSIATIDAIKKDNVILCNDKKVFSNYINYFSDDKTKASISFLDFHKEKYMNDIKELLDIVKEVQGIKKANINTLVKKAPNSIKNSFINLKYYERCAKISDFKNIYKGKTALILSAGPSLRENIELVKENKDKYVIFVVGAAINILFEYGIKPDFILDIEENWNRVQYLNLDLKDSYMIFESFTSHDKFKVESKGKILYVSKDNFINNWLRELIDETEPLKTLGTVSYTALTSAYIMGFKKIILLGQDLAYRNGECYAKGSQFDCIECVFDENQNKYVVRIKNEEKYTNPTDPTIKEILPHAIRHVNFLNKNIYTVKSQTGDYIPTQVGYAIFVKYFEEFVNDINSQEKNIEFINSSTGGAQINGYKNVPFNEVVKDLDEVQKIELNIVSNISKQKIKTHVSDVIKELSEYKKLITDIKESCAKIINELKIKKIITDNAVKYIKKHNESLSSLLRYHGNLNLVQLYAQFNYQLFPIIEKINTIKENEYIELYMEFNAVYNQMSAYIKSYIENLANI